MRADRFFIKAIFLTLSIAFFNSCTQSELKEETGTHEHEEFQIEKEGIQHPDDR